MTLRVLLIGGDHSLAKEADAFEAITPGHAIYLRPSDTKAAKATGPKKPFMVATENDLFGAQGGPSYGINDPYVANDRVIYYIPCRGAEIQGLVGAAAPAIAYDDYLQVSATVPGCLEKTVTLANAVAVARQAVNNSAGGTQVRIRAEAL